METSENQKWVNLSFLALAALIGFLLFRSGNYAISVWDLETKIKYAEAIVRFGSVGLAAIIFFFLWRDDRANQFMNEVVTELSRVTFPTYKETLGSTIYVVIMVIISGLVLGFFDYLCTVLMKRIMQGG